MLLGLAGLAHSAPAPEYQYQVLYALNPAERPSANGHVEATPAPVEFSGQAVGVSATRSVTLRNTSLVEVGLAGLGLAEGTDFSQSNDCGTRLASGAACQVAVQFTPSQAGLRSDALVLRYADKELLVDVRGTGLQGRLQMETATLQFPPVVVGASTRRSLRMTNVGTAPLSLLSFSPSGTEFNVDYRDCGATLPVQGSCLLDIEFTPLGLGARTGSFSVATPAGTAQAELTGTGIQGTASFGVASLSFGAVQVGASSAVHALTLSNTGDAALTVTQVAVSDGQFSQTNNCASIAPGASCRIEVVLAPTAAGPVAGNLEVAHNGAGPVRLALTGTALAPSASLAAPEFADTPVGTSSVAYATLTNTGAGALTVEAVAAASVTGAGFSFESSTCGATLAPDMQCRIAVRFSATHAGSAAGALQVTTSAGVKSTTLAALAAQGRASLSASNVTFESLQVGLAATRTITLSNTGNAPLAVASVTVSEGAPVFSVTSACSVVPVQGSCPLTVRFSPAADGNFEGVLTLAHDGEGVFSAALAGTGRAPAASLSTPAFAATKVGATSQAVAVLTNTGLAAIGVTPPTAASVTGPDFSFVATSCETTLAAGATCSVTVRFAPSSSAGSTGTLGVMTQAGNKSVVLSTTGIQGIASISPAALAFGSQQVGSGGAVLAAVVTNTGTAPLQFSGLGLASGSADFAQSNDCALVAVGQSCTVNVLFTPSAEGARSGVVGLAHDGGGLAAITLAGTGVAPSAQLSVASFPATAVGTSSTAVALLTNTGIGPLSVSGPTVAAVTGTGFSFVATTCTDSLAVGQSCGTTVRYAPANAGSHTGQLALGTAAGTKRVALVGSAVQGVAYASPASLSFAGTQVGTTSGAQALTLTNTGDALLTMTGIGLVEGAADFGQSNNCATLAPGASCTVTVSFTPQASGVRNGVLGLVHDGAGTSIIELAGTGQNASASLNAPVFPATPVGSASTAAAVLTNTGVGNLSVSLPATIGAGSSSAFAYYPALTNCPALLAPGASCQLGVRFAPTSTSASTGTLAVATGAGTQVAVLGSTGIQGVASVSPASLTYPLQQTGSTSAARTVTVTNTGTDSLAFTGVGIAEGSAHFAQSNNCASVPVGGTCVVHVTYSPGTPGSHTGTLALTHNGGGAATVSLAGSSQAASAALVAPAFPVTAINATSLADATLTNTGVGALTVTTPTAASVTGVGYAFAATTCTGSLAPGASCTVQVRFQPTSTAPLSGTVTLATGAGERAVSWQASAAPVDFSAQLAAYRNAQAATSGNPGWSMALGQWYSVNAGGSYTAAYGTRSVGRTVFISGTAPVTSKLRQMADDSLANLRVNGALVQGSIHASYADVNESNSFVLYPGVNSITLDVTNGGSWNNPYGWVLQVWDAAGANLLAGSDGWYYSGAAEPVLVVSPDAAGYEYADRTVAGSCKQYRQPAPGYAAATASGYYLVDMGAGREQVYCDMVTDGGGWTLVARSAPESTYNGDFGWYAAVGAPSVLDAPYSMNVMGRNLQFAETLFGDAPGNANTWSSYVYKSPVSRSWVAGYTTTVASLGYPTPVSPGASTAFGMAACVGFTSSSRQSYFFRDMCSAPDSYGLWARGWITAYGDGPNDVAGQPVGASFGGYINHRQGLLMVR